MKLLDLSAEGDWFPGTWHCTNNCRGPEIHPQRSVFTVVTDNCHSNTVLVSHVTEDFKRFLSTLSIRIDDVRVTWSPRVGVFDITAGSISWKVKRHRETTISQKIIPVLTGKENYWREKPFKRLYIFIFQKFHFHEKWRKTKTAE